MIVALIGIFLAMTAVSLNNSIERAGPDGMASAVVSELRAARAEATRSGMTVAVCFPNDARNLPVSRSFLVRKGEQIGATQRARSFDRDFNAGVFIGSWPGATLGPNELDSTWLAGSDLDYVLAFQPDGTLVTNGLPVLDGAVPLVVASRLTTQLGANGFFEATAISNAHTIWVDNSGGVRLQTGQTPVGVAGGGGGDLVFAADVLAPFRVPRGPQPAAS